MTDDAAPHFVESLARGLAVIRAFDASRPEMTLAELARATGLARATTRRFLLTLVDLGYARTDGRQFSLTPRVLELGFSYLSGLPLAELARPILEALSHELGESTSASVLDGDDIVYVARVPTRRIMNVTITIGTRFPAFATSMGRVLLAELPPAELSGVLARLGQAAPTARTETNPDRLREILGEVHRQGWALVDQELEDGLRSIAAPVRGDDGTVVAAINVATSTTGATLEQMHDVYRPALLRAAAELGTALAHARPSLHGGAAPRP
ncbi:IclR family transcriptional regulator C-terminal domain-containing protein [Lysinimonas soli]|uniref:IclR family transcriptional regulator C-terminal domain-containing protein n=1 Tax=Lysinimonas soli TaxID=1074233 RepID=A0ABW0NR97_9MICO